MADYATHMRPSKLRQARANRGGPRSSRRPLTLKDLVERTGYSESHLSEVERGIKRAGDKMVEALARALGTTVKRMRRICDETYQEAQRAA